MLWFWAVEDRLPITHIMLEACHQTSETGNLIESTDFVPRRLRKPTMSWIRIRIVKADATGQQKSPFDLFDGLLLFEDVDGEKEREEQFVLFEE